MAGCTVSIYLMLVVSSAIVGVVGGPGVAGLADSIPGFTLLIKGEVVRPLLENGKVKATFNMPCP